MGPEWVEPFLIYALVWVVICAVTGAPNLRARFAPTVRRLRHVDPRPWDLSDVQPLRRPLELIVSDARRLGSRFQNPPPGTSFAKVEAVRCAYDRVLGEACEALGMTHLLGVLMPGSELDEERSRVEGALWLAGLRFDEAA
jgi:hypothetical protein